MPTRLTPADLAERRILVVGEAILDEYIHGNVARLSREAPVPIVANPVTTQRCGGAANAAANIAALGSTVTLLAAGGDDAAGRELALCCTSAGITANLLSQPRTNVKQRILGAGQQLVRVDHMCPAAALADKIAATAVTQLSNHDAVLLSDYGTNLLAAAPVIISAAAKQGLPVIVDPRSTDWARYAGATLIKPSVAEFMPQLQLTDAALAAHANTLMAEHNFGAMLFTGGRQGMLICPAGQAPIHQPTRAREVYDVTGAGDTVAAVMTLALAAQASVAQAAELANKAAGIVVGRLGAVPITPAELNLPPQSGGGVVTDLDQLLKQLAPHRSKGEYVVMTNGCFDILHAGHLDTLGAAAALGDVLVVAVNDDESVRQLKGPDRPIIPITERLQLLAGLGCIDYVLPFAGPDAAAAVTAIAPDVYVKGGDWEGKEPPEAQAAKENGGRVVYEGFRQEQSTTDILKAVRAAD